MFEWFKSYGVISLRETMEFSEIPLYHFLESSAREFPNNVGCSFLEKEFKCSEMLEYTNKVANYVSKFVDKGDRVLINLSNCPEFIIAVSPKLIISTEVVCEDVPHILVEHREKDEFWEIVRNTEAKEIRVPINPKEDVAGIAKCSALGNEHHNIQDPRNYDDIADKVNRYRPIMVVGVPKQYMKLLNKNMDILLAISGSAPIAKGGCREIF